MVENFGIGQSEFMWAVRSLPRVRAAFATLWGTFDLITSFGGAVVHRPAELKAGSLGYHLDQHPVDRPNPFDCVQGILNLVRASPLGFVPRSHKDFPNFWL